jgi:hypothetical protein
MEAENVLELVVFRLRPGVARVEFVESNEPVSSWIAGQPGFISRDLSYEAESDRWVDVIWWETLGEAEAASQRALGSDTCAPMFAMIEMDDMLFLHAEAAIPRVGRPVKEVEAR